MKSFSKKEEQIFLAICHLGEGAYLIPIREEIKKYTGKYYSVGTIYAPLNRLHIYGYLETYIKKTHPTISKKPIKYYKLTKKGLAALADLKRQNEMMWRGIEPQTLED